MKKLTDCGYTGSRVYKYRQGCRCEPCKQAYSEMKKAGRRDGAGWVARDRARHAERLRQRRAAGERI